MADGMRTKLNLAVGDLSEALRKSNLSKPLRVKVQAPEKTKSGGWSAVIATLGPSRRDVDIEIWFDKWLDGKTPVFWAGFGAFKEQSIRDLIADCSESFPNNKIIRDSDYRKSYSGMLASLPI